jgi:hypothetical protein
MQTGSRVSQIRRSALAWVGDWTSKKNLSPSEWDPRIWEMMATDSFSPESSVLAHQGHGFEVHQMRWSPDDARKLFGKDVFQQIRDQYPSIDQRVAKKSVFLFVFAWGDPEDMELKNIMDIPISDGYLVIASVLSDTDRLLPLLIHWSGAPIDDLSDRVNQAISWMQNVVTSPKVPAPILPYQTIDYIESARSGNIERSQQTKVVSDFISLDRSSFLELCDRLWPWIQDPNGPAGWLDKDSRFADHLWDILGEVSELERPGVLRLAPWKTGLGQPKGLKELVSEDTRDHSRSRVFFERTVHGSSRAGVLHKGNR